MIKPIVIKAPWLFKILLLGYNAITLYPFIFLSKSPKIKTLKHEYIHIKQQVEMLVIPFYIWYSIEYIIKKFMYENAYRNLSFEKEAYANDTKIYYLKNRKPYAWVKYITNNG